MKNLNKLIRILQSYYCLGLYFGILQAQVVITEFFINSADSTQIPQYIELYNTSSDTISLEDWSIITKDEIGVVSSWSTEFSYDNDDWVTIHNSDLKIEPNGYFLISSNHIGGNIFSNNHNSNIEVLFNLSEAGSIYLYDSTSVVPEVIDQVEYGIPDSNWPIKTGYSMILQLSDDTWSRSPDTEKSLWLYEENTEIKNFGSPREENSFRLNGVEDFYHIISGDVNNIYNADNNYEDNNYGVPLEFSWEGTFDDKPDQQYRLIIEKTNILKPEKHGFEIESYPDTTIIRENIIEINTSISPTSLDIDQLEIADYSWTIELTKGMDIIYSDRHYFTVDASDYGIYGCVDHSFCNINELDMPTCPTTADDDTLFSNHPLECVPDENCFSALNYYEDANINSNTCHYVSLSIPAFVTGDSSDVITVPVYMYNDSLANIDSIAYTLSFDNSLGIISYENGRFSGTVISELGDENIKYDDDTDSISVDWALSEEEITFQGAGIITYLNFKLIGSPGEFINLSFSEVRVKGGIPGNDISVPVSGEGELVILQTDYEIWGNVVYYSGDNPYEVPNVELTLEKRYDGDSSETNYSEITNEDGYYNFNSLTEGNYNLSFSKVSGNDCNGNYISGTDISRISRHVTGSEPFIADQIIAADVSLDGTVSGYDISLVAQYDVDLIDNFNDIPTHWIFQPFDLQTLPDVHAELVKENVQYSIEYKPLVLDDKNRKILAYRLGDVDGNYCHDDCHQYKLETECNMYDHCWWDNEYDECAHAYNDQLSRFNSGQVQFTNIAIDYTPVITLPLIISEAIFLEGMDIEIGFDKNVFSPHSITFNTSNIKTERYNSISNLLSRDGSIKTVTWAIDEPQIVEGIIGEVSFNWNNKNKSGKIWLKEFQVNDEPAIGGISIVGLNDNDVADGVNIINSLVPVELSLHQNYPNPFNPQTTIKWSMPLSGIVSLEVYNLQGQHIDHLFGGFKEAGMHEQVWDASAFPSGIYFSRMTLNKKTLQKKMLLLK